jgi:homoserine dehydrogenase
MTPPRPILRVGLIGYGTVGRAFARALDDNLPRLVARLDAEPRITRIAVRNPDRVRPLAPTALVDDDPDGLTGDPQLDVIVEASGARHADRWILAALARGTAAISANKLAIASSPGLLAALAGRHPLLHCEGAVAAAIPIVRALRDSLDGEQVHELRGVLNGTSTFVLSEVERGAGFSAALDVAVDRGFAERTGAGDLDGRDAAAKVAILATLAWRTPITLGQVRRRGFDARIVPRVTEAFARGARVRLVAHAWRGNVPRLVVEPRVLERGDPLATVTGVTNAVEIRAALAGQLHWFGPGAGGDCTASGLLSDLIMAAEVLRRRLPRNRAA